MTFYKEVALGLEMGIDTGSFRTRHFKESISSALSLCDYSSQ
jgi:hypothetical protein